MKLSIIFKLIQEGAKAHAPELLTGLGIGSYAMFGYLLVKASDKCKVKISKRKEELNLEKLPAGEIVKTCAKDMILPSLAFGIGTLCVISSTNIQKNTIKELLAKNASLALACKGAEVALDEFEKKTKEAVGEETYNDIKHKVTESLASKEELPAVSSLEPVKPWRWDGTYGGWIHKTDLEIKDIFHNIHTRLTDRNSYEEFIYLQDLYDELHDKPLGIGDDYVYYAKDYDSHNKFDVTFSEYTDIAPNGERYVTIFYDKAQPWEKDSMR